MPKTNFEELKTILKAHPEAQPLAHRRTRTPQSDPAQPRARPPNPERHSRKCRICRHPDRDAIEFDFLRWRSSVAIAKDYGLPHHSAICRHARATGLFDRRDQTVAYALDPILEQSETVAIRATASTIVSAVTAYAKINGKGRWVRPKRINNIYFITPEEIPGQSPSSAVGGKTGSAHGRQTGSAPAGKTESAPGGKPRFCPEDFMANREIQKLVSTLTR